MKNLSLSILACFFAVQFIAAQANILNATSPDEIGQLPEFERSSNDGPLPYGYVEDKDVLFSKTIWEVIDLDERINFPMYYPSDTTVVGKERRPLIHYLFTAVRDSLIFNIYEEDNLKDIKPREKLERQLVYRKIREGSSENPIGLERINIAGGKTTFLQSSGINIPSDLLQFEAQYNEGLFDDDPSIDDKYNAWQAALDNLIFDNNLLTEEEYSEEKFNYADVVEYRVKGVWYFDKRQSELKYRPIAIAPIIIEPQSKANNPEDPKYISLFWLFYPDCREVLFEAQAFNSTNTSKSINFDHLINSRRFSTYIYKEDNVYQDRAINEYIPDNALMQLMESERIKEKIRNLEQDMWSY
jgi:gliding motility associated protien GldN